MQDRSLKIYKPQDIDGLLNIDKLKLKTTQDCERMLEETKQKCALLEKNAYEEGLKKLHSEQAQLFQQTYSKVSDFFQSAQENLNGILKVLVEKMKMDENSVNILTSLLFAEVEKLKIKSLKFTIYANGNILPILQTNIRKEYDLHDGVQFDYDIKDDLRDEECLVESDYVMARISVVDFQEKVMKILAENILPKV